MRRGASTPSSVTRLRPVRSTPTPTRCTAGPADTDATWNAGRAEPHEVAVAHAAHRAQQLQVRDRLEEVGLALAVVAHERDAVGRNREVGALDVPEVADRDATRA